LGISQVRTLAGHSDEVFSVTISLEGRFVVSGSADKLVKIWNAETGAEVSSVGGVRSGWWGGAGVLREGRLANGAGSGLM
jgi:WD40 repeat protein